MILIGIGPVIQSLVAMYVKHGRELFPLKIKIGFFRTIRIKFKGLNIIFVPVNS
jgi:uncharacterized membrane protein YesL